MKKMKMLTIFAFIGILNFMIISPVMAYEEPDWEGEECLTTDNWLSSAKVEKDFDPSTGKFTTSGMTAQEYRSKQNVEMTIVFYEASSDGKTLTAYVPSYKGNASDEDASAKLEEAGIDTGYSCETTLKITKTVSDDNPDNPDNPDDPSNPGGGGGSDLDQDCPYGYTWDSGLESCVADNNKKTETRNTGNTASPASIAATAIGAGLVVLAAYIFLNKNNKLSIGKKK